MFFLSFHFDFILFLLFVCFLPLSERQQLSLDLRGGNSFVNTKTFLRGILVTWHLKCFVLDLVLQGHSFEHARVHWRFHVTLIIWTALLFIWILLIARLILYLILFLIPQFLSWYLLCVLEIRIYLIIIILLCWVSHEVFLLFIFLISNRFLGFLIVAGLLLVHLRNQVFKLFPKRIISFALLSLLNIWIIWHRHLIWVSLRISLQLDLLISFFRLHIGRTVILISERVFSSLLINFVRGKILVSELVHWRFGAHQHFILDLTGIREVRKVLKLVQGVNLLVVLSRVLTLIFL